MSENPKLALQLLRRSSHKDNSGIHLQLAKYALMPSAADWDQAFKEWDKTLVGVKHIGVIKR